MTDEVVLDPGTGLPLTPEERANFEARTETPTVEGETVEESLPETPVTTETNETGTSEENLEAGSDN